MKPSLLFTPPEGWVAVVDDHPSMRSMLARTLSVEGIHAETFESAEDFLARTTTAPRCLVVDVQLPGMSGHELAHVLERERPPLPPVIFISGHHELLTSLEGCSCAHDRLGKPFEVEAFLALVNERLATTTSRLRLAGSAPRNVSAR